MFFFSKAATTNKQLLGTFNISLHLIDNLFPFSYTCSNNMIRSSIFLSLPVLLFLSAGLVSDCNDVKTDFRENNYSVRLNLKILIALLCFQI